MLLWTLLRVLLPYCRPAGRRDLLLLPVVLLGLLPPLLLLGRRSTLLTGHQDLQQQGSQPNLLY